MSLAGIADANRSRTAHEFVRATLRKAILDGASPQEAYLRHGKF